jgi:hypothetical protein
MNPWQTVVHGRKQRSSMPETGMAGSDREHIPNVKLNKI